jgi:hypothetical protein
MGRPAPYPRFVTAVRTALLPFLLLTLFVFGLGGCKKTVENQTAAWKSNLKTVEALQAKYPGFKPALQARIDEAKPMHEAASSLEGDAAIDKLSSANSTLMKGFVRDLDRVEKLTKELREARVEVTAKAGDASQREGAKVAAADAEKALSRTEEALKKGARSPGDADAVVKKIISDLETAKKAIDKVAGVQKDKDDKAKADKDAKDKKDADAKAAVADWKCEYCGNMNPHDKKECGGCGAPKTGKKK